MRFLLFSYRNRCLVLILWAVLSTVSALFAAIPLHAAEWYKGNLHTHTAWSDGRELPELVACWYKNHSYDFVMLSDHNTVDDGTKYTDTVAKTTWLSDSLSRAEATFGSAWNVTNGTGTAAKVKLKTFDEINAAVGSSGFLLLNGEEVTCVTYVDGVQYDVHVNAINTTKTIAAKNGTTTSNTSVLQCLKDNLESIRTTSANTNRTILSQINHTNWGSKRPYDISAEEVAVTDAQLYEVCNAGGNCYNSGGTYQGHSYPSTDKQWDIVNTIRIREGRLPIYGTATDDSHFYTASATPVNDCNAGRGYVMVHADCLSNDAIVKALSAGDFYASTGITLSNVDYNAPSHTLTVSVLAEENVNYRIDFIGTLKDAEVTRNADGSYSADVGKVLKSVVGTSASYTLGENDLYVRAFIYSDKTMDILDKSTGSIRNEVAWTQPVGRWIEIPEPQTCTMMTIGVLITAACNWRKVRCFGNHPGILRSSLNSCRHGWRSDSSQDSAGLRPSVNTDLFNP